MATFLETFGDGSDGAYTGGALVKGQEYNFTSFDLDAPLTLGAGDGKKIVVRVQGDLTLGSSVAIISNAADGTTKDSDTVTVVGSAVSVASVDGVSGGIGGGGHGGYNNPVYPAGSGGNGGSTGNGSPGGAGYGSGTPGAGGVYPSGDGADATVGTYPSVGAGGGGGAAGAIPSYQNGLLFIVGGAVVLAGSITGIGSNGGAGGAGGAGSDGTSPYNPKQGGGGGGGGAGRGGSGGLVVKFYTTASLAGSVSTTVTAGTGGIGGIGGAHGYDVFSYTQPATDGGAGTSGSAGTAGGVSSAIIATTPLVYNEVFTISDVWSTIAELDFYMETESGGAAITERGFVWAETTAPTTSDTKEVYAGTSGLMEKSFTGLAGGTTYYCRAFATNSVGTTYGTEFEFKTQPSFLPQIITCG